MSGSRAWTGPSSSQAWGLPARRRRGQGRLAGARPPSWPFGTPGCLRMTSCEESWKLAPKKSRATFGAGPLLAGALRVRRETAGQTAPQRIPWAHFLLLLLPLVWKPGPLPSPYPPTPPPAATSTLLPLRCHTRGPQAQS